MNLLNSVKDHGFFIRFLLRDKVSHFRNCQRANHFRSRQRKRPSPSIVVSSSPETVYQAIAMLSWLPPTSGILSVVFKVMSTAAEIVIAAQHLTSMTPRLPARADSRPASSKRCCYKKVYNSGSNEEQHADGLSPAFEHQADERSRISQQQQCWCHWIAPGFVRPFHVRSLPAQDINSCNRHPVENQPSADHRICQVVECTLHFP